jgi:peptide/nickel transport system ATP-binding protein
VNAILNIRGLSVEYATPRGPVAALRRVDLEVPRGSIVGIVGESGSGKSTLIAAATRLLPASAIIRDGAVEFDGLDMLALPPERLRALRGRRIAIVFQDPMTALNPVLSVGRQMIDIQYREQLGRTEKQAKAIEMLRRVGIPDPQERMRCYPHEFSGGMRQRVAIAMALLGNPDLLIADEPTSALDATLEAQIIHLLRQLKREFRGSILFISHNLGLIAELCDHVVMLYAGEVVERGTVDEIFYRPYHPYTRALLACEPGRLEEVGRTLPTIVGEVPDLIRLPTGCIFAPRCAQVIARCRSEAPGEHVLHPGHGARCHLAGP